MRRRTSPSGPLPGWVLSLDPERYRAAAADHLAARPGDTFGAAMAVWHAYLRARRDCLKAHGRRRWVGGRDVFGTPRPPIRWVMDKFGTPPPGRWWG